MLLTDHEITQYAGSGLIYPFEPTTVSVPNHLSYGLSSSSYEVRIDPIFKLFTNSATDVIDPTNFNSACYEQIDGEILIMPPNSFALSVTMETFNLPTDISILCIGKSTYARCGIIINTTMVNPGTSGKIVLELSNTAPRPVMIRAGNNGVAKFMFFKSEKCSIPYNGVYKNQKSIVLPTVKK